MVDKAIALADSIMAQTFARMPAHYDSWPARVMIRAIGLQESKFETRQQYHGPARSFWQFERGGISGVLRHAVTYRDSRILCAEEGVTASVDGVYDAMLTNDVIGCGFARLLLFTDPEPLPVVGDAAAAWAYYLRLWRPGLPRKETWSGNYERALER